MLDNICYNCRKEIGENEYGYPLMLNKDKRVFICEECNKKMQKEQLEEE